MGLTRYQVRPIFIIEKLESTDNGSMLPAIRQQS